MEQGAEEVAFAAAIEAGDRMDEAAQQLKDALQPLSDALALVPAELLQELADSNLNVHHALGRLNSARAMLRRLESRA